MLSTNRYDTTRVDFSNRYDFRTSVGLSYEPLITHLIRQKNDKIRQYRISTASRAQVTSFSRLFFWRVLRFETHAISYRLFSTEMRELISKLL